MRSPTLAWVMIAAYQSEINYSISCFWDGGWTLRLGDELNGFESSSVYETVADLERDMPKEICRLYPKSKFAKEYMEQRGDGFDDEKAVEEESCSQNGPGVG